jgi:hypothetical protein
MSFRIVREAQEAREARDCGGAEVPGLMQSLQRRWERVFEEE